MSMGISLKERLAQWAEFNRQKEAEAIAHPMTPEDSLQWAGEVLDLVIARDGELAIEPNSHEGIRIMHERLALIRPRQQK